MGDKELEEFMIKFGVKSIKMDEPEIIPLTIGGVSVQYRGRNPYSTKFEAIRLEIDRTGFDRLLEETVPDAALRAKHPALQTAYEQYITLRTLLQDAV